MRKTLAVASVTLREVLRRKVQVNLLLFGAALILASAILSTLTIGDMHRMIADLGLSAMRFIGTLLAVFLGASLVAGDIDKRVIGPIVTKPLARWQYVLGRYLGLVAALLLNLAVMAALLGALLAIHAGGLGPIDASYLAAVGLVGVHLAVVAAVATFFSTLTNVTLAAIFSLAVAIAGLLTNEMRALWKDGPSWIASTIWYVVPNLGALNANEAVIYRALPPSGAWLAAAYGVLYAATALALAATLFERRDLR